MVHQSTPDTATCALQDCPECALTAKSSAPIDLDAVLTMRAAQPEHGMVYIEGGWVQRLASIPTDAGAPTLFRFADRTWRACTRLQLAALQAHTTLRLAEDALRRLAAADLTTDVALALASVLRAQELLDS